MINVIVDPKLLDQVMGMYVYMDFQHHPLSDSTLLDNCGATYLVNFKDLLVLGFFVKSRSIECVEAGSSSLPIIGRGTRVLQNALYSNVHPLTLMNVVVVEGFNVNIVSEARLSESGLWYQGLDCSLRLGTLDKSVVVK